MSCSDFQKEENVPQISCAKSQKKNQKKKRQVCLNNFTSHPVPWAGIAKSCSILDWKVPISTFPLLVECLKYQFICTFGDHGPKWFPTQRFKFQNGLPIGSITNFSCQVTHTSCPCHQCCGWLHHRDEPDKWCPVDIKGWDLRIQLRGCSRVNPPIFQKKTCLYPHPSSRLKISAFINLSSYFQVERKKV